MFYHSKYLLESLTNVSAHIRVAGGPHVARGQDVAQACSMVIKSVA